MNNFSLISTKFIKIGVTLSFLLLIGIFTPFQDIIGHLSALHGAVIFISLSLILLNIFLSSVRLKILMDKNFMVTSFQNVHYINIISQLAGLFFIQTIGQIISRTSVGALYLKNTQRFVFITIVEKIISLSILLLIASIAMLLVFDVSFFNKIMAYYYSIIVGCVIIISIISYYVVLRRYQRIFINITRDFIIYLNIPLLCVVNSIMHACMILAYSYVAITLLGDEGDYYTLLLIVSIAMTITSLPISFAGWGVRELSLASLFSYAGYDSSVGVTAGISIGFLAIIATLMHSAIIFLWGADNQEKHKKFSYPFKHITSLTIERVLSFIGPAIIAILLYFQLYISTTDGAISLNLADIAAIILACMFAWFIISDGSITIWRIKGTSLALAALGFMLAIEWLNGFILQGYSQWALYNRLFGGFILFCYLLSGAMLVAFHSGRAVSIIALILSVGYIVSFVAQEILISHI